MRVKIVANIVDENGALDPCYHRTPDGCDVHDLSTSIAEDYINRRLAIAWPGKGPVAAAEVIEDIESAGEIETPEDGLPEKETATIKRRRRAG